MNCKYIVLLSLCFTRLWFSFVCDSTSDISLNPKNEDSIASSQEQILNVITENLNSELHGTSESKTSAGSENLELPENKVIVSPVDSIESAKNEKPQYLDQSHQTDNSNNPNEEVVALQDAEHATSGDLDAPISAEPAPLSDNENQDAPAVQIAQGAAVELKDVDHPPFQVSLEENSDPEFIAESKVSLDNVANADLYEQEQPPSEEMPLFDDWKKMMLAGQEEGGQKSLLPVAPGKKLASQKRRRNYASSECGAKIVASNQEAEGTSRILTELSDEYMLNPCQAKVWFVIELCESVQTSQIELANYELFSSLPKGFAVYSSNNFPTRDWVALGVFTAAEQRVLQSFPLVQEGYGKFIKIEMQSHYGNEYYCPLSIVRIFGTSMVDEYEEMETLSSHPVHQDDDLDRIVDLPIEHHKGTSTIFGSATDAVYNIVKKAARALLPHQQGEGESSEKKDLNVSETKHCKVPDKSCSEEKSSKLSQPDLLPSIHPTLFNYLRRCEQCIKTSKPSYHSVSEPHCRFFQAVMGPVLFTSLCDWFREHHLTTITHHQIPVVDASDNTSSTATKTTSPPPVIRVIIESNQSHPHTLPSSSNGSSSSQKSEDISKKTSDLPPLNVLSDGLKLETVIKPTKTTSTMIDGSHMDLSGVTASDSYVEKPKRDSAISTEEHVIVEDAIVAEPPPVPSVTSGEEVILPSVTSVPITTPSITPNETHETAEATSEDIPTVMVVPSTMDVTTDDLAETFKSADERFTDTKDPGMKLETIAVGGMASQKESVFIRMNHRIKALELNMSLSSQYLQELSRRYRRQMEEMQRSFNRTINTLNDTARKAAERDLKQQEAIETLQAQVTNLTLIVDHLLTERSSVMQKMLEVHVFLMVAEAIIMITVMSLCVRRVSSASYQNQVLTQSITPVVSRKRHNSTDSSGTRSAAKIHKRSSSEEVISPGNHLLIIEPATAAPLPKGKKKNKKRKGLHRSASNPTMSPHKECAPGKKRNKESSSAAGIIFTHSSTYLQMDSENVDRSCENYDKSSTPNCNKKLQHALKGIKRNSVPLKNLTNEDFERYNKTAGQGFSGKERFNFRKFLSFQKRESI